MLERIFKRGKPTGGQMQTEAVLDEAQEPQLPEGVLLFKFVYSQNGRKAHAIILEDIPEKYRSKVLQQALGVSQRAVLYPDNVFAGGYRDEKDMFVRYEIVMQGSWGAAQNSENF